MVRRELFEKCAHSGAYRTDRLTRLARICGACASHPILNSVAAAAAAPATAGAAVADGREPPSPRGKGMQSGRHAPVAAKGPKGGAASRSTKHFADEGEEEEPQAGAGGRGRERGRGRGLSVGVGVGVG